MASNGENAMFMQRMEDSSLRQLWRLTHVPHQRPEAGRLPKEMLKMKIDPTMCMKTKERVTKWTTICRAFWLKMHELRGNSGRNRRSADLFAAFRACRDRYDGHAMCPLTPTRKTWGPLPAPAGESAGSGPPSPARGEG